MDIEMVSIEYGSKEYLDSLTIRNEIFRKPYGLDMKDDNLEDEKYMEMYGAYIDGKLIGTVFLDEKAPDTAQVKSVSLIEEFRGIGLGNYLMEFIEDVARKKGYTKSFLMGRVYAENFYNKLGYKTISQPFDHKTIPHIDMEKIL